MLLVNRMITRGRHSANDDGRHRSLGMMPIWWLGGSLVIAILFAATALSQPSSQPRYMTGLHPTESATQAEEQEESDRWWQSDVDPRFAIDGLFAIQPAAGSLDEVEIQTCYILTEELTCHGEH